MTSSQSIEIALRRTLIGAASLYTNLGFMYALAGDVRRDHEMRPGGDR